MAKTIEQLQEEAMILEVAKQGRRKEQLQNAISNVKKGSSKISGFLGNAVGSRSAVSRSVAPQRTILSKEQAMLNSMFGQKHQLWGGNNPVTINGTLQNGGGLIKTGTGNDTRRLFLP